MNTLVYAANAYSTWSFIMKYKVKRHRKPSHIKYDISKLHLCLSVTWNWDTIDYRWVTWISTAGCLQTMGVLYFNLVLYGWDIGEKVVLSPLKVLQLRLWWWSFQFEQFLSVYCLRFCLLCTIQRLDIIHIGLFLMAVKYDINIWLVPILEFVTPFRVIPE